MRKIIADSGDVIIIGNGPINHDYSKIVEDAAYVVRINYCNHLNEGCGIKTDLLALTNSGSPLLEMLKSYQKGRHNVLDLTSEVLLVRNYFLYKSNQLWLRLNHNPEAEFFKLIPKFEFAQVLPHHLIYVGVISSWRLNNKLRRQQQGKSFLMPSTGMLTIEYILGQMGWQKNRVKIMGFSHQGWIHHPWEAERSLIRKYEAAGYLQIFP